MQFTGYWLCVILLFRSGIFAFKCSRAEEIFNLLQELMQCNSINVVEESMMMSRSGHTPEMDMSRTPQTPSSESPQAQTHAEEKKIKKSSAQEITSEPSHIDVFRFGELRFLSHDINILLSWCILKWWSSSVAVYARCRRPELVLFPAWQKNTFFFPPRCRCCFFIQHLQSISSKWEDKRERYCWIHLSKYFEFVKFYW